MAPPLRQSLLRHGDGKAHDRSPPAQALPKWRAMTGAWNVPLFFGEFGANDDPNPDNQDFQVMPPPRPSSVTGLLHAVRPMPRIGRPAAACNHAANGALTRILPNLAQLSTCMCMRAGAQLHRHVL